MENEYSCDVRLEPLPYGHIRWVKDPATDLNSIKCPSDTKKVKDMKGNPLILFTNEWSIRLLLERNEGIELTEYKKDGIFVMGFRPFYILKSGRGLCRLEIKGEFVALTACKIKVGLKFLF